MKNGPLLALGGPLIRDENEDDQRTRRPSRLASSKALAQKLTTNSMRHRITRLGKATIAQANVTICIAATACGAVAPVFALSGRLRCGEPSRLSALPLAKKLNESSQILGHRVVA
jgi:hypothetical protein